MFVWRKEGGVGVLTQDAASVPVEVNSCPVKAFVDSGAQSTISEIYALDHYPLGLNELYLPVSPECAEACGYVGGRILSTMTLSHDTQDHAPRRQTVLWYRQGCGHCQDPRKGT